MTRTYEKSKTKLIVFLRETIFWSPEHKLNHRKELYQVFRYWNHRHGYEIKIKVYNNCKKVPVHWSWKIPTKCKGNAITGGLHGYKRTTPDFNCEVIRVTKNFLSNEFCRNVITNTTAYFNKNKDYFLITEWLFDDQKLIIARLPFSESNGEFIKSLVENVVIFRDNKCKFSIEILNQSFRINQMWNTTAILFTEVIVHIVETVSLNLSETWF